MASGLIRAVRLWALLWPLWSAVPATGAEGPPQQPFLRIETGEHTAAVRRLAVNAEGRLAATISDDKSIRLWQLPDGEPLGVLRVPIDEGAEGELHALAMAPDGSRLVVSGHTGITWDGAASLYVFDLEAGRMIGRVARQPHVINDLAYSPDGRFVAAVLGGNEGLRVWDSKSFKLVFADPKYGGRGAWVSFAPDGRLVTAAFDGLIRLYRRPTPDQFELSLSRPAPGGKAPYSLSFSPDAELLAVGHYEGGAVDILSGRTLEPLYRAAGGDLGNGNLAAVAWSRDGAELLLWAGGSAHAADGRRFIRRWSGAGRGPSLDIPVAGSNLNALTQIPGGRLGFVSSDPSWGLVDAKGQPTLTRQGRTADFRSLYAGRFGVSADASMVDFGIAFGGTQPLRFDAKRMHLDTEPPKDELTTPPRLRVGDQALQNWQDRADPALGTVQLVLTPGDQAHSGALSADGRTLVIGGEHRLYLYRGSAEPLRRQSTEAPVWGVVISGDGRIAVAALGDGTLRWYSLVPGQELSLLGSLFVVPGTSTWVAWTPEGFFAHSSDGGQRLVGLHFNTTAAGNPLFTDFSQLYNQLHQPELVSARLGGRPFAGSTEIKAKAEAFIAELRRQPLPRARWIAYCPQRPAADAAGTRGFARVKEAPPPLPAVVPPQEECHPIAAATRGFARLAATPTTSAQPTQEPGGASLRSEHKWVRLQFEVADMGSGLGIIDFFHNGRLINRFPPPAQSPVALAGTSGGAPGVPGNQGEGAKNQRLEHLVELRPGRNDFEIRAYNLMRAFARSPGLTLIAPEESTRGIEQKPRLFLVAVGVNAYVQSPLTYAVADAEAVTKALQRVGVTSYQEVKLIERYNQQATQADLTGMLLDLAKQVHSGDTLVLYVAGHGLTDERTEQYYFLPYDAITSSNWIQERAIGQGQLAGGLGQIQAAGANIMLMLDTCFAGAVGNASSSRQIAGQINNATGMLTLAGAAGYQEAIDAFRDSRHGLMAHYLLLGLQGQGDFRPGDKLSAEELGKWVAYAATREGRRSSHSQSVEVMKGDNIYFRDFELGRVPVPEPTQALAGTGIGRAAESK